MKERTNLALCRGLIGLVKPLSLQMSFAILLGTLGHLFALLIPVLGVVTLLEVLGSGFGFKINTLLVTVALLALLRGLMRYGEQYLNHFIAFKLLAHIRSLVFTALRRLTPAKLEGKDRGDLISLITSDIELLEVFYAHTISPVAIALLVALCLGVYLASVDPLLCLLALLAYLTVGVLLPLATSKRAGDKGLEFRTQAGKLSAFVLDSLRGLSETMQYDYGEKRLEAMLLKSKKLVAIEEKMKEGAGRNNALTQIVILAFDLLMLLVVVLLYTKGRVEFSGALVSLVLLMSSFGPFVALASLGSGLQQTFAAANRVLGLLEERPMTEEIQGMSSCSFSGAQVKDINFSYGGEEILEDISVDFPQGKVIGILGKSGSGKSTLLKLLMRFWEVQRGEICLSNRKINNINTTDLRDMESYVTQETHLFSDSIANNLRIAKLDASQEELETACKKASVHEFITTLPRGYETPVGELGDKLSGGERQRIGLARAFLHGAPFLLLDEPTSNLDSLNEAVILKSIVKEKEDKTVVLVSHRDSTMALADQVYSVEHGRLS